MNQGLSYWADIISIVSGGMTILGISGILTSSLVKKGETPFSNSVIRVLAYSIRIFFCVVFALAMFGISYYPWYFLSLFSTSSWTCISASSVLCNSTREFHRLYLL